MAFLHVFVANSSVVTGNPTKTSDFRILGRNADAFRERFVIGHHFNNAGTTNEDGFHKGDNTNPTWFYAKTTGGATASYFCLYLDPRSKNNVRLHLATTTAAPTAYQGRLVILGADTAPTLL